MLTHFHEDHYAGFLKSGGKFEFDEFCYQKLPIIEDLSDKSCDKTEILAFLICISNIMDCIDTDMGMIYGFFRKLSDRVRLRAVGNGDRVCFSQIFRDVMAIWPPEKWPASASQARNDVGCDDDGKPNRSSREDSVTDVASEIGRAFASLSALDGRFIAEQYDLFRSSIVKLDGRENSHSEIDLLRTFQTFFSKINGKSDCIRKYMELIGRHDCNTIRKKIPYIANRFSVCVHAENEFLMLGDLPDGTIGKCINSNFKNGSCFHVRYLITAHHGTHWNKACDRIDAEYVISSNGKQRIGNFRHEYCGCIRNSRYGDMMACRIHNTYCLGDFIG